MTGDQRTLRQRVLDRVQRRLCSRSSPRAEMAMIVCATGAAGFLASASMLLLGLRAMAVRYVLAVCIAWAMFLFFVWIWLSAKRGVLDVEPVVETVVDLGDAVLDIVPDAVGGAAESGDAPLGDLACAADEFVVVLAVLAAAIAGAAAAGYMIATAPAFFAEVLLDGVLSYGLYRRLRGLDRRHWLESAVSRTVVPFAVVAVVFAIAGAVMHHYVPEGDSIGDVWNQLMEGG